MIINPHQETIENIVIFLSLRLTEFCLIFVVLLALSYIPCFISFISNLNFPFVLVIDCLGNIFEVGFHWSRGRADFLQKKTGVWCSWLSHSLSMREVPGSIPVSSIFLTIQHLLIFCIVIFLERNVINH